MHSYIHAYIQTCIHICIHTYYYTYTYKVILIDANVILVRLYLELENSIFAQYSNLRTGDITCIH